MKSAQQWIKEWKDSEEEFDSDEAFVKRFTEILELVQLDSWKSGMRHAMAIASNISLPKDATMERIDYAIEAMEQKLKATNKICN